VNSKRHEFITGYAAGENGGEQQANEQFTGKCLEIGD